MPPILTTFSKNQFDILASTGGNDNGNGNNDIDANNNTNKPSAFEELTKDLLMEDMESVEGDHDDNVMSLTQDLDWDFGENKNGHDDVEDATSDEEDNTNNDDPLETFGSQEDDSEDEAELEENVEKTPPSSGRKKAKALNLHAKDETCPPADDDDASEKPTSDHDGENSSSDDDDDSDNSGDDKTVDMSDEEADKPSLEETKATDDNKQPQPEVTKPANEEDEDSDAWLDGSGDEGKKWREQKISYSESEDSEDEEKQTEDSQDKSKVEMPLADSDDDESPADKDSSKESSAADDDGSDASDSEDKTKSTPRRSVRERKAPTVYSDSEESPAAKKKIVKGKRPSKKVWTAAVDELFAQVEDRETFTIKQLLDGLREKFDCKIGKKWKNEIIQRLKKLIARAEKEEAAAEEDDADDEASIAEDDGSDYEDDAMTTRSKRRSAKRGKAARPKKLNKRIAARAKKVMEKQKQKRRQRLEEMKVRNEEMQLQSTEDVERADAIAAKFETNNDALRLKRLEDRLDLLQQLDQKRISVVEIKEEIVTKQEEPEPVVEEPAPKDSESEDSSSEEEDLVIVGMKKPLKPLKPLQNHLPSSALELLNGIRSPVAKKKARPIKRETMVLSPNRMITSPGKSMGARFALRNALKQKQRKAGNLWLARELGYKKEEDHLKDCQAAAEQKRELVLKLEQERLKANERKQLRERLLLQEASGEMEAGDEEADENAEKSPGADGEEEDEEMQMAKAIERESSTAESGADEPVEATTEAGETPESEGGESVEMPQSENPEGADMPTDLAADGMDEDVNDSDQDDSQKDLETQPPVGLEEGSAPEEVSADAAMTNSNNSNPAPAPEDDVSVTGEDSQLLETQPPMELPVDKQEDSTESATEDSQEQEPESQFLDTQPPIVPTNDAETAEIEDSVVTPDKEGEASPDAPEEDKEADDGDDEAENERETVEESNRPKNSIFQEALRREAEKLKKQKRKKGDLVEEEAEEEEEEEVAGLEDFGFTVSKKKKDDDDDDGAHDQLDADDLEHIVDEVSDGEGDEEAGMAARRKMEAAEEKRQHKEFLRRAREGHDGRRGGIAGGSSGARGLHGFDQLVAPDNRADAKALGLLNEDEMDSDDENDKEKKDDDEDDELAMLDKDLRRRHLHQSDVNLEEELSSDEEDEEEELQVGDDANESDVEEEKAQRRLNKLFKKRATMLDYEQRYGNDEEFSQQRLIDEDTSMKEELKRMRNGLVRRRSTSSGISQSSFCSDTNSRSAFSMPPHKKPRRGSASMATRTSGSLSIALLASRKVVRKTSFLGSMKDSSFTSESSQLMFNNSQSSRSCFGNSRTINEEGSNLGGGTKRKFGSTTTTTTTLFSSVMGGR